MSRNEVNEPGWIFDRSSNHPSKAKPPMPKSPRGFYGYMVFGDIPGFHTIAGSVFIVASGLYIIHRERMKAGPEAAVIVSPDPAIAASAEDQKDSAG